MGKENSKKPGTMRSCLTGTKSQASRETPLGSWQSARGKFSLQISFVILLHRISPRVWYDLWFHWVTGHGQHDENGRLGAIIVTASRVSRRPPSPALSSRASVDNVSGRAFRGSLTSSAKASVTNVYLWNLQLTNCVHSVLVHMNRPRPIVTLGQD